MHTSEVSKCARSTAEQQVTAYIELGYTGIIITDHFINGYSNCPEHLPWDKKMLFFTSGYNNAKKAGDKYGLDVFFGWEFTIRGADFLTYGLDLEFLLANPGMDKLDFYEYSALVRKHGGYLAQAHPYRKEYYIEHNYPVEPYLVDGVEVFNAVDTTMANTRSFMFAKEHDLPMQAGTDSHRAGNYKYSGIVLQNKAKSIYDIIKDIKNKNIDLL